MQSTRSERNISLSYSSTVSIKGNKTECRKNCNGETASGFALLACRFTIRGMGMDSPQWRAEGGKRGDGPSIQGGEGIKRVKLQKSHFIKLLKIYAFSYHKSTNTCCIDLIGSCLGGMV